MENLNLPKFSVLISVYEKEKPEFLDASLKSLFTQTYMSNNIVLVCDGTLNDELDNVIDKYKAEFSDIFDVVRLPENVGTAAAANAGIERCENEYIMKMDSDDICLPERCKVQLEFIAAHPEADLVGSYIEEFESETGNTISIRKVPTEMEEIKRFAKRRSPFNNQTIIYKKSLARKIGGYEKLTRCEDYDFMVRMIIGGANCANIPKVLVRYRVTKDNLNRRRNWTNTKYFIKVRKKIHKTGFSSLWDLIVPCTMQLLLFLTPGFLTKRIYNKMLRK